MDPQIPGRPLPQFPTRHPLGAWALLRDDPLGFLVRLAQDYSGAVGFRVGPMRTAFFSHPEAIRRVLVDNHQNYDKQTRAYEVLRTFLGNGLLTSEGDFWRRQRRIAQPAFHRRRIATFGDVIVADTHDMLKRWEQVASEGGVVELSHEMMSLTLRVVGQTLLGAKVENHTEPVAGAVAVLNAWAYSALNSFLPLSFPTRDRLRARLSSRRLERIIEGIIAARRASNDNGDLLGMLMSASDAETGETMTDRQLRDESMTMFLAGHETTANALSWTFYLLSTHPDVERKVRRELAEVLAGRSPGVDDLARLPYLTQVIKEAMRLFPPAWIIERRAVADDVVMGYPIRKGTLVLISPYATHHHPEFWPNPEGFDPDRFEPEREEARPRYAYFPFGGGQRQCIGNAFAMMEAQLILATVLQRFRPWLVPGHRVEPEPLITLRPRYGLKMGLEPVRAESRPLAIAR